MQVLTYFPACSVAHAQGVVLQGGIPGLIQEEFFGTHARTEYQFFLMMHSGSVLPVIPVRNAARAIYQLPTLIPITDALLELRRLAVKKGFMLPEHRKISEMVMECGHAVPLDEETKQKREELGLDPIPVTVQKYPEALQEVRNLLKACKFNELVAEK